MEHSLSSHLEAVLRNDVRGDLRSRSLKTPPHALPVGTGMVCTDVRGADPASIPSDATVADVVYARFVRPRPDRLAFARVWSFSAAPEALARVIDEVYALIDQRVAELDAAAPEGARPANVSFVAVEPPDDERWRRRRG
ncbi:MAG: hypothetical protein H6721_33800 [Sandaracinus sp.]|nr:hypothetical protein [Sandaracinus sp.]MCB9637111.1 hypothetical protein [Sandaracinus sp.]